jgi:hypothetical protein
MIAMNDRPTIAGATLGPNPAIEAPGLTHPADVLLLSRLRWFAFLLTIVYGAVLIWVLSTRDDLHQPLVVLLGLRVTLALVFLGVLFGPMAETPSRLRWCELALFGGLAICLALSPYLIGGDLIRAGDGPGFLAHEKGILIELLILMFAHGMLIPHDARRASVVVVTLSLAPFSALGLLLMGQETPAPILAELHTVEHIGQNALIVLIGAGLAIYAAATLNRLRSQAHGATRRG